MKEFQLCEITKKVKINKYTENQEIITESQLGNSLYIVKIGKVHLYKNNVFIREFESKGIFGSMP